MKTKEINMRLIDADELKEKLLKIQAGIVNEKVPRGNTKSDVWKLAYLLVFDEYIKMLDEMPSATQHYDCNHDCDAIYEAYNRGYSKGSDDTLNECDPLYTALRRAYLKGREDAINEYHLLKDYCKKDYNTLNKMRKEQKMENSEAAKDELWSKIIKDLKTLNQEAHDEEFVPFITGALVMTALRLRTDVIHGTIKQEDKSYMWILVDDLGCYSIKGETIMYLPEYKDLTALLRKVF